MTKKIDLSDMLSAPGQAKRKGVVISLDDLRSPPTKVEEAVEVVVFWTDWLCQCGSRYEAPTYGDTFTRYQRYSKGEENGSVYKTYLDANHCDLPRKVDMKHILIRHCPQCVYEDQVDRDRQRDLFAEG